MWRWSGLATLRSLTFFSVWRTASRPISSMQIVRSAMFSRWHDRLSTKFSPAASFSRLAQSTS
jgi:hypothetical protein